MYKLSVIVPAYNAEKYLERCLNSLLDQTYSNIEIIVVNDGSKDKTKEILDEYSKKYSNILALHQENKGVSEARNNGLKMATGNYIGFLDCDDYIKPEMYEKLMSKIIQDDYDLVACDTTAVYPDKEILISSNIADNQNVSKLLIDAYAVIWNKVYKKSLIDGIYFKKDVWYEDILYLYQVYTRVQKVGSINEALHYYMQNENSITYTYNDKLYDVITNMDQIVTYYKEEGIFDKYKEELEYSYVRYLFATFIKRLAKSRNKSKYSEGTNYVIQKVREQFPNYKCNKYINQKNGKSIYLKKFNKFISWVIYFKEKNKMN